jgi:hypothetical protein
MAASEEAVGKVVDGALGSATTGVLVALRTATAATAAVNAGDTRHDAEREELVERSRRRVVPVAVPVAVGAAAKVDGGRLAGLSASARTDAGSSRRDGKSYDAASAVAAGPRGG